MKKFKCTTSFKTEEDVIKTDLIITPTLNNHLSVEIERIIDSGLKGYEGDVLQNARICLPPKEIKKLKKYFEDGI